MKKLLITFFLLIYTSSFGQCVLPNSIPRLVLWMKADSLTGFADGDTVSSINDLSSANNDGSSGTGAKPYFRENLVNKHHALEFRAGRDDGVGDVIDFTDLSEDSLEVFIVVKVRDDPGVGVDSTGFWTFTTNVTDRSHFPYTDGIIYDSFGSTTRQTVGNPSTSLAQWNIYNVTSVAGEWTARLNNTQIFTTGTNTVAVDWCLLGSSSQAPGTNIYLNGWIAEFFVFGAVLTSSQRTDMYNYLNTEYFGAGCNPQTGIRRRGAARTQRMD